jgi:hypothetical protein
MLITKKLVFNLLILFSFSFFLGKTFLKKELITVDLPSEFNIAKSPDKSSLIVILNNPSFFPVSVIKITTSCGCISAFLSDHIIYPFNSTKLNVCVNRNVHGRITQDILIEYKIGKSNKVLQIKLRGWNLPDGYVYVPNSERLTLGTISQGKAITNSFQIYGNRETLKSLSLKSESECLSIKSDGLILNKYPNIGIDLINVNIVAKINSKSNEHSSINIVSKNEHLNIPVIWEIEKSSLNKIRNVYLGKLSSNKPCSITLSFVGIDCFEILESKSGLAKIESQSYYNNETKIVIKLQTNILQSKLLDGSILLKSHNTGKIFEIKWSGYFSAGNLAMFIPSDMGHTSRNVL